jgi:hypothetical protein
VPSPRQQGRLVTGYSKGLNGIMVDVADLPASAPIGAGNFTFQVGSGDGTWSDAPAPAEVASRGVPSTGPAVTRVTVTWADRAITNQWVRVTFTPASDVPVGGPGGPVNADVFYFGNLRGETDPADSDPATLVVNASDLAATKRGLTTTTVGIDNVADHNRDGRVNALDIAQLKQNLARRIGLFTAPPPPMGPAAASALPPLWRDTNDDLLA